ncbi:MAG: ATP-binding protein [Patescibacteria group bacterium]|nr:ATP-binding protein [Patescibacteria group bacterium]
MFNSFSRKINVGKYFEYSPRDVAIAFKAVAEERYGTEAIHGVRKRIFRSPVMIDLIKVQGGETQGIIGSLLIVHPSLRGTFTIGQKISLIEYEIAEQYKAETLSFLDAIDAYLKTKSIYQGKPIDISGEFIDLSGINQDDLIYAPSTHDELDANLWTLIEKGDSCKAAGITIRKRRVLLTGQFGAGKTTTALLTAKKGMRHGWTFIRVPPSSRKEEGAIGAALELARHYQPAIVFIEEIDHEQRSHNSYAFKKILDDIDGALSKSAEIIILMTANKSDAIEGAMQRPGRMDAIIELGKLTTPEIRKIIEATIRSQHLDQNIAWGKVAEHCTDYPPAFVREIGTNALLSMVSKNQTIITTDILIGAADRLRNQHKACARAMGFSKD